jgi:hypothetical protein
MGYVDNEPKYKNNIFSLYKEYFGLVFVTLILYIISYNYNLDLVKNFDFGIKSISNGLFVNILSSIFVIFVYDIVKTRREESDRRKRLSLQFSELHNLLHTHFAYLITYKWLKICEPSNKVVAYYSDRFNLNKDNSGNKKSFQLLEAGIFRMIIDLQNILKRLYDHKYIMQDVAAEIIYEISEKDKKI